jgi:hypothetical protein
MDPGLGNGVAHSSGGPSFPIVLHYLIISPAADGAEGIVRGANAFPVLKIVLVAAGPLFIALGLFWFGQAAGVLSGLHYAVLIDVGADVAALGLGGSRRGSPGLVVAGNLSGHLLRRPYHCAGWSASFWAFARSIRTLIPRIIASSVILDAMSR